MVEVARNERLVGIAEDALERTAGGGSLDRLVDFRNGRGALGNELEVDDETFGVGTRIDEPSSLPFSSGMTRPTALAAPVEVGIIERAAARARYRSLCIWSSEGWSFV